MKIIETDGISYIKPVPGALADWYYGFSYEHGDLYEAEEVFREGHLLKGWRFCLVHYPDGKVYVPVPEREGSYSDQPVFLDGSIFIVNADFPEGLIRIIRFDCTDRKTEIHAQLPLSSIRNCYNLSLQTAPLTLTRQCVGENEFEIVWPEKVRFFMGDHDAFFLRDGGRLFFSRWHEEGEGADYRYWEETIVRDMDGKVLEILPGDVMRMPNGELWHIKSFQTEERNR